jgi:hypothetical protein
MALGIPVKPAFKHPATPTVWTAQQQTQQQTAEQVDPFHGVTRESKTGHPSFDYVPFCRFWLCA